MNDDAIKPNFPGREGADCYEYLASMGMKAGVLRFCCVKSGEVVGLTSRQSVIVRIDGDDFPDVPVWIHTDVGTRMAMIKGEELSTPEDYFKDSALMFPKGEPGDYPEVLVLVHREAGVETPVAVIQVLRNMQKEFPLIPLVPISPAYSPFPTYGMYALVNIAASTPGVGEIFREYSLLDVINGGFGILPHYVNGVPELPVVVAEALLPERIDDIEAFLARGFLSSHFAGVTGYKFQGDMSLEDRGSEETSRCFDEDGVEHFEVDGFSWQEVSSGQWQCSCYGGSLATSVVGDYPYGAYTRTSTEDVPRISVFSRGYGVSNMVYSYEEPWAMGGVCSFTGEVSMERHISGYEHSTYTQIPGTPTTHTSTMYRSYAESCTVTAPNGSSSFSYTLVGGEGIEYITNKIWLSFVVAENLFWNIGAYSSMTIIEKLTGTSPDFIKSVVPVDYANAFVLQEGLISEGPGVALINYIQNRFGDYILNPGSGQGIEDYLTATVKVYIVPADLRIPSL